MLFAQQKAIVPGTAAWGLTVAQKSLEYISVNITEMSQNWAGGL